MFEEAIKSIRAHLYERSTSPLMGSFIASWLVWNYKFILLVFSSEDLAGKYSYINDVLYATWEQMYLQGGIYPLATALLYIFAYPHPARWTLGYSRKQQKIINDKKREIENETLLTLDESRKIRREHVQIADSYEAELNKKNREIESLKGELEEIAEIQNQSKISHEDTPLEDGNTNNQRDPLEKLETHLEKTLKVFLVEKKPSVTTICSLLSEKEIHAKYNLEQLENKGLVKSNYRQNGWIYELTENGRAYLVEKGLVD